MVKIVKRWICGQIIRLIKCLAGISWLVNGENVDRLTEGDQTAAELDGGNVDRWCMRVIKPTAGISKISLQLLCDVLES